MKVPKKSIKDQRERGTERYNYWGPERYGAYCRGMVQSRRGEKNEKID